MKYRADAEVQPMGDSRYGFNIRNEHQTPIVVLEYLSKPEAEAARTLIEKAVTNAANITGRGAP
jgi:hypothetical protein